MDSNRRTGIDLHVHSTASDGSCSPSQIIALADRLNLGALAITDHDTLDGSRQALAAGIPAGLHFLAGVEISASRPDTFPGPGSFHLLGYDIRLDDPALNRTLEKLQNARARRNPRIIERLAALGLPLRRDEIAGADADRGQIGRPHIASAMVAKGYVSSIDEAFDRFLGTGRPAYVDKFRVSCEQAIRTIADAGGVAVLAHPGLLGIGSADRFEALVAELKRYGLGGIEAYYPEHARRQTAFYIDVAARNGLLVTGGTDFHGDVKPKILIGSGAGGFHVPFEVYENLMADRRGRGARRPPETAPRSGGSQPPGRTMDEGERVALERKLGVSFFDPALLEEALRHSSFVNEQNDPTLRNNERLEFLGDAVLNLVVGHILMVRYPDLAEGALSRMRAALVNESRLAAISRNLGVGRHIRLGKGEIQTDGRRKKSILADALEAVFAAIYLDGGFEVAHRLIDALFSPFLDSVAVRAVQQDYKSRLQEHVQTLRGAMPRYRTVRTSGPDHDKTFHVSLAVRDLTVEGEGKSKKSAEQDAARQALDALALSEAAGREEASPPR